MSKADNKTDYPTGYGKPPAQYRFKKGQSGNPKGRPRKATKKPRPPRFQDGRLDDLLEQEAFRSLQLHENGKPVEMSAVQAITRSLIVEGVKGNRLAKKYTFEMLRQEERDALERSLERYEYLARKKAEGEAKIERCKAQGVPPPRLFPHPEDILLDEAKLEVHLLGPLSEDRAIPYERAALFRDWFYARSALEEKYGKVTTIEFEGKSVPVGGVFAEILDAGLPPSFQRNDVSKINFLMGLNRLGKRQLQRQMKALMAQIEDMPDSIEERLAARERAVKVVGMIGEGLEKAVADIAEKH